MGSDDLQDQLSHYISFVEKVLKPKLLNAESAANVVRAEITDYEELTRRLNQRIAAGISEESLGSVVDIGYKTIFCNAVVKDPSKIFVKVGLGFHVEMELNEASRFAKKRISYLRKNRLAEKEAEIKEINGHIQSASIILDQLHAEMKRS
mmetsp:Transcript_28017/g.76087  ORF Transcript_28017/g.76087 Transcript_28017/m.76087 type:complete len:150 (+) Transcript_28017:58-507(+)